MVVMAVQYHLYLFLCILTMHLKVVKISETASKKPKNQKNQNHKMEMGGKTTNFVTCFTTVKKKKQGEKNLPTSFPKNVLSLNSDDLLLRMLEES